MEINRSGYPVEKTSILTREIVDEKRFMRIITSDDEIFHSMLCVYVYVISRESIVTFQSMRNPMVSNDQH